MTDEKVSYSLAGTTHLILTHFLLQLEECRLATSPILCAFILKGHADSSVKLGFSLFACIAKYNKEKNWKFKYSHSSLFTLFQLCFLLCLRVVFSITCFGSCRFVFQLS